MARKLQAFLTWLGLECKIFNVGKYRRAAAAQLAFQNAKGKSHSERERTGSCSAEFFDPNNTEAAELRAHVADLALRDMLRWLDGEDEEGGYRRKGSLSSIGEEGEVQERDRIAIFDATNSTAERRRWILEECTSPKKRPGKPTGVVFVESLCDDEELLEENFRYKVLNSPDFTGMSEEDAMADLRQRVKKYEDQYETLTDDSQSYIKVYNLSAKILVNHCYGRMVHAKEHASSYECGVLVSNSVSSVVCFVRIPPSPQNQAKMVVSSRSCIIWEDFCVYFSPHRLSSGCFLFPCLTPLISNRSQRSSHGI